MSLKLKIARQITRATKKARQIGPVRCLVLMLAATMTALACGWSYITDHSVRFNSYRTGRGFYRLPPLPIMYDSKTGKELTVAEVEEAEYSDEEEADRGDNDTQGDRSISDTDAVWDQAREAEKSGNFSKAQAALQNYLELTAQPTTDEDSDRQLRRNSAYDMLDAMTALKQGSNIKSVKAYLDARYIYDDGPTQSLEEMIRQAPADKNLQDNWEYLQAALLFQKQEKENALQAFQKHTAKYPYSEKNDAALYMVARLTMESSHSFENKGCGIIGKDEWGKEIDAAKIEPIEKCQDENWRAAVKDFQQLMRKYPNGRHFNDSRGWLAYLYRRGGERAKALAEYYRLLGDPNDRNSRLEAKKSLQMIGDEYDDETLDKVEALISSDSKTAMAYAYYRIYNYATDHTYETISQWCCYNESNRWQEEQDEKKRVSDEHNTGNHELNRIARFATAMLERYPQARMNGGFVLRIAEAQLELQNYPDALSLSRKALGLGLSGDFRAQALWVKGSAEHQGKNFKVARATFNQLISEFPKAKLTEGARRLLAMTAEDQDDLESALDQYLALNYQYDVAYFVDVLMPTDRLAKFVSTHKQIEQHDQLLYALGIRYMRESRWDEARATLRLVATKPGTSNDYDSSEYNRNPFPKEPEWDSGEKAYIKSSWVMQDIKTIDTMQSLELAVDNAQGDETKAEAMYQLASYQFDADSLLFYNPAAWQGIRSELLSQLDEGESMRLPNESQNLFSYSQSHDTLARSIPIYVDIVQRYPQTKAARDALFSAAVAHERLSNLNEYWRHIYEEGLFAGPENLTFRDITRLYPKFRWPISRIGWEASTRTVNGGSPYPPPPKPAPKLTRTQKIERIVTRLGDKFVTVMRPKFDAALEATTSFLRGCIYGLLTIVGMLIIGSSTALYFWKIHGPAKQREISQLLLTESSLEQLPNSESRLAKVIEAD